jgi:hypothetical protein
VAMPPRWTRTWPCAPTTPFLVSSGLKPAPPAQDYLRKHPDCEVYTGQDETLDMKAIREQASQACMRDVSDKIA